MKGVELLPELACDRMMPLWVARARGIPPRLGVVRWTWVPATARASKPRRVWWVGYSEGEASFPRHLLRHGLALAVARYFLGAGPEAWDALAVREARQGASRRTIRGRAWARENREQLRGAPRPDGEWWRMHEVIRGFWHYERDPWAVEVDAGKLPLEVYRKRLEAWVGLYSGVVIVTLSHLRAMAWLGQVLPRFLDAYPGWASRVQVYALEEWWEERARWREVWSGTSRRTT